MSQASVSRRVSELEADLGVVLFERRRHDVEPTGDADRLAASVRLALRELASTATHLRGRRDDTLTIVCSAALAPVVVVPILGEFQRRHPDRNVRVVSACEPVDQTAEAFDIAVQYGSEASERFAVEVLSAEPVYPVCAPTLAERLPPDSDLARLIDLGLLEVDDTTRDWPTEYSRPSNISSVSIVTRTFPTAGVRISKRF